MRVPGANPSYGRNTDVDASAEPLTAVSTKVAVGVVVKVVAANTKTIYFGNDSGVTAANGFPVVGGDSQSFDAGFFNGDLANLYCIGSEANLAVAYWYV